MKLVKQIERDVQRLDFSNKAIIQHHLARYDEHQNKYRWDDACSQLRKALEQIISDIANTTAKANDDEIAHKHISIQNHEFLGYLKDKQFFSPYEGSLINAFYGFLSDKSAHPGIPKKGEAATKIDIALTLLDAILRKYLSWIENGYQFAPDTLPGFPFRTLNALKKVLLKKVDVSEHYTPKIVLTQNSMEVTYKAKSKEEAEKYPVHAKISVFSKAADKFKKMLSGLETVEFDDTELADVELFLGDYLVKSKEIGEKIKIVVSPNIPEKPMRLFIPGTDTGFDYILMKVEKADEDNIYFNARTEDEVYNFKLIFPLKNIAEGKIIFNMNAEKATVCHLIKFENFIRILFDKQEIVLKSIELDKIIFKATQINVDKDALLSQEDFKVYEDLCFIQQNKNIKISLPKEITKDDLNAIYKIKNIIVKKKEEQSVKVVKFRMTKQQILIMINNPEGLSNIMFRMQKIYQENLFDLQIPLGRMEITFKKAEFAKPIAQIKHEIEQYKEDDVCEIALKPLPLNSKNAVVKYV